MLRLIEGDMGELSKVIEMYTLIEILIFTIAYIPQSSNINIFQIYVFFYLYFFSKV